MKGAFYGSNKYGVGFLSERNPRYALAEPTDRYGSEGLWLRHGRQDRRQHSVLYLRYHKNHGSLGHSDFDYCIHSKLFSAGEDQKILGRFHGIWANILAALLGTVTPFCSCSSIPLFIGFTSAGLSPGVTFSFLISSPMVDLGSLLLLMSIFGWKVAFVYVILGLVIAVAGGTLIEKLHLENQVEEFIRNGRSVDVPQEELHFKDRIRYAWEQVLSTAKKVAPYVLIGVGIGAVIHNWIPEDFIVKVLGDNNPFGVILATIAGIPIYADIFGTLPIAEALLEKGALVGVVLSFMMGVTTLSLPSMILLRKAVKPKLLGIFVAICTVGIILVGYFFNAIQNIIL